MTIDELERRLKNLKLPYRNYCLKGGYLEDGICLFQKDGIWEVYYCERRKKTMIAMFYNENDAGEYMFCIYKKEADNYRWF